MSSFDDTNNFRIRGGWVRKRYPEPRDVKLSLAELNRVCSSLKLLANIEDYAIGIFNRARIGNKITEKEKLVLLASSSIFLACEKHNLIFTDKQYEEAIGKKIKEIKESADSIKEFKNPNFIS